MSSYGLGHRIVLIDSDEDGINQTETEEDFDEGVSHSGSNSSSVDLFEDPQEHTEDTETEDELQEMQVDDTGVNNIADRDAAVPRPPTPIPPADETSSAGSESLHQSGEVLESRLANNNSLTEFASPKKVHPASPKLDSTVKDEECECCPICFEAWTNSGSHRLVSLKCGHLFGQSCIERWLRSQATKGGKCPQCNAKANKKDIRTIFAKALKTVDTTERDRALGELEKEKTARRKAELDGAQARLRYQMALDECNRLRQEMDRQRHQLQTLRQQSTSGDISKDSASSQQPRTMQGPAYTLHTNIKVWEPGGCRVMAFCNHLATLVISQPSASPLFPGFGIKKISALDFKSSEYVSIHSKMIRDIAFNDANPDGILLSAAMDKSIKMTSVLSNAVVQTYQCSMPVWSCSWCMDDKNYFYAGLQNGTVLVYDIRNTLEHVQELNKEGSRSPVVSMQYVNADPSSSFRPGGLVVGQLDRSTLYERKSNEYKVHALPMEGSLTSISLQTSTRHLLASFRPAAKHPSVRHQVFEMTSTSLTNDPTVMEHECSCNHVQTFHGGRTQKMLSRSRIFLQPGADTNMLVCAGDEATQSVHIWDAGNGQLRQKLAVAGVPVDLCTFKVNDCDFLAALTDKYAKIFRWS